MANPWDVIAIEDRVAEDWGVSEVVEPDSLLSTAGKAISQFGPLTQASVGGQLRALGESFGTNDAKAYKQERVRGLEADIRQSGLTLRSLTEAGLSARSGRAITLNERIRRSSAELDRVQRTPADTLADERATLDVESLAMKDVADGGELADDRGFSAPEAIARTGQQTFKAGMEEAARRAPVVEPGSFKQYTADVLSAATLMVPSIVVGAVSRNPNAALATMFPQVYGVDYGQRREEEKTPEQAGLETLALSSSEILTEKTPIGILLKPGGKLLPRILKTAGAEGIQESIQGGVEALIDAGILRSDMTVGEAAKVLGDPETLKSIGYQGLVGAGMGAILAGPAHAAQAVLNRKRKTETSQTPDSEWEPVESIPITGDIVEQAPEAPISTPVPQAAPETAQAPEVTVTPPLAPEIAAPPAPTAEFAPVYADPRLKRNTYRNAIKLSLERDFVEGGGSALVPDESFKPGESDKPGEIPLKRTPSLNPPWVQELLAATGLSVRDVRKAAEKAVAGERLGVRQAEAVNLLLEQVTGERTSNESLLYAKAQLDQAREIRRQINADLVSMGELDAMAPPDDAGELFDEEHYSPELDALSRHILEVSEEAISRGGDRDVIDDILSRQIPDAQVLRSLVVYSEGLRRETETRAVERQPQSPVAPVQAEPQGQQAPTAPAPPAAQGLTLPPPTPIPAGPLTRALSRAQGDLLGGVSPTQQAVQDAAVARDKAIAASPPVESDEGDLFSGRARQTDIEDVTGKAVTRPQLYVEFEGQRYPVKSYKDASEKWDKFRGKVIADGRSASEVPTAIVTDQDGKQLGHIAWNGRVFEGRPQDWKTGTKLLYDNRAKKSEKRAAAPVAESQAPAPSEPGEGGVATTKDGDTPRPEKGYKRIPVKVGESSVNVDYSRESVGRVGDQDHFEFHGDLTSTTGYKSLFVHRDLVDAAGGPEAYAKAAAEVLSKETAKDRKREARAQKKARQEANDATTVRSDAGQVRQAGVDVEERQDQGREDIQQPESGEPGGAVQPRADEAEVTQEVTPSVETTAEQAHIKDEEPEDATRTRPETGDLEGGREVGADRGEDRGPVGVGLEEQDLTAGEGRDTGVSPESAKRDRGTSADAGETRRGERPPSRTRDTGNVRRESGPVVTRSDFTITDADEIGAGGAKTKYRNNVAAIRLLKQLDEDQRRATPDEQAILAKYVGWGGLKNAFNPDSKDWAKEHTELKELLTAEEFEAARRSILDAHYTSVPIVRAMWDAMKRMGFKGGRLLEPSVGVGNFLGLMPKAIRSDSTILGVELDRITGGIAKQLYQSADIASPRGFQEVNLPSDSFDAAIGNPPFGSQKLFDERHPEFQKFSIHNYFFAKTLDKLRPGGLLTMVVSRYFMDSTDAAVRKHIADRARLVAAIRLPETAFKGNAGTEVVTDIIVLQKLKPGEKADNSWINTVTPDKFAINQYFIENPRQVLGRFDETGSMYAGGTLTVKPTGDLVEQLRAAIESLPEDIYEPAGGEEMIERLVEAEGLAPETVKIGGLFETPDGKIAVRLEDSSKTDEHGNSVRRHHVLPDMPKATTNRVKGMIQVRDALRDVMRAELTQAQDTADLKKLRTKLNNVYDKFRRQFGYINSIGNRRAFQDDPDLPLLESLEPNYDPGVSKATAKTKGIKARDPKAEKASIFTKRVLAPYTQVTKADTPKDALVASMNEKGKVDLDYMEQITGTAPDTLTHELAGLIYLDPTTDQWEVADAYLTGNVKTKLVTAKEAAETDKRFASNVEALEKVQPPPLSASDISVRLGSTWVPPEVVAQFATELLGVQAQAHFIPAVGRWSFKAKGDGTAFTSTWGTQRVPADEIISHILNMKPIVVKDNHGTSREPKYVVNEEETQAAKAKGEDVAQKFRDWIWLDQSRRERLENIFNETFNTNRRRQFDGQHLTLPGMSPSIHLRQHQKAAIWRMVQERSVLLDHVVGAGKTFEMIGAAMEMRRLGIARKPFFTVPNHLVRQWRDEFYRLYPNANILATTEKDFQKANRKKLFSRIATGDWDAVIVAHSSFKKIGMPKDAEQEILGEMLNDLSTAIEELKRERGDRNVLRDMERIKENLEGKVKRLNSKTGKKDDVVTFDELGADAMFVDEAHLFKNLFYFSQMSGVAGLGNPGGSGRAFDMFVKTRFLQKRAGGRGVTVFATGTPVSNSLVEMFTMQRYMAYDELKSRGVHLLDSWARVFGDVQNVYEVHPSGSGYRLSNRFAKFVNMPELMTLYRQFADVITLDDLKDQAKAAGKRFPVPKLKGGKPQLKVAERSEQQVQFFGVPEFGRTSDGGIQFKHDTDLTVGKTKEGDKWQVVTKDGHPVSEALDTEADATAERDRLVTEPNVGYNKGSILWKFENLRELTKKTDGKINALSITNEARKAGLDFRLIDPNAPDFSGSKVNIAVDEVKRIYDAWQADKGTQLCFCDLSVPQSAKSKILADAAAQLKKEQEQSLEEDRDSDETETASTDETTPQEEEEAKISMDQLLATQSKFSVYDDMKQKLIAKGIPSDQIAFIHDYDTADKKAKLYQLVRDGVVRVLFGSTEKMGAGMNVQDRLVAIHHLDAPWRPSDLEQRNGRIQRQGNKLYERDPDGFDIEELRYATKQTYDTRMWQIIEHKARGVEQLRKADETTREIDDISGEAASAADMKAAASGNPLILDEIKLRTEVRSLEAQEGNYMRSLFDLQRKEQFLNKADERFEAKKEEINRWIKKAKDNTTKDFTINVGEKRYDRKGMAGPMIAKMGEAIKQISQKFIPAGEYRGIQFGFQANVSADVVTAKLSIDGNDWTSFATYGKGDDFSPSGFVTRMENFITGLDRGIEQASKERDAQKAELVKVKAELSKPFAKKSELDEKRQQHREVVRKLQQAGGAVEMTDEMKAELAAAQAERLGKKPLLSRGSRKVGRDDTLVSAALSFLSGNDELFQLPISKAKTMQGIAAEVMPTVMVRDFIDDNSTLTFDINAKRAWAFTLKDKDGKTQTATALELPGREIYLNITDFRGGGAGNRLYHIVANYAFNKGLTFIGDPHGIDSLSDAALYRRTQNMLASAMKFGTTRHIAPHERQMAGDTDLGVMPLEWETGNDAHNINRLAEVAYSSVVRKVSEMANITYNFEARRFEDADGNEVSDKRFVELAATAGARAARAGRDTLKRTALVNSLVQAEGPDARSRVLGSVLRQSGEYLDPALRSTFYSRPQALPQGGLSVSDVRNVIAPITEKWTGADIRVVQGAAAIPEYALPSDVEGAYVGGGRVYLVAGNLADADHVREVLAHEAVGHLAAEELLDTGVYKRALVEVQRLEREGNKTIKKLGAFIDLAQPGLNADTRAREILAVAVQRGQHSKIGVLRKLVADIVHHIKALLRRLGFDGKWVNGMAEGELWAMMRDAARRLERKIQPRPRPAPAYSRTSEKPPLFYSAVERGLADAKQEKAPVQDWKAILKRLPGVKQEELDAIGVNDWLDTQKGPVTKADVLDFVKANGVQVSEVTRGGTSDKATAEMRELAGTLEGRGYNLAWQPSVTTGEYDVLDYIERPGEYDKNNLTVSYYAENNFDGMPKDDREKALRILELSKQTSINAETTYEQYTLPGGENYRELLLTLPDRATNEINELAKKRDALLGQKGDIPTNDLQEAHEIQKQIDALSSQRKEFKSSHFPEPNILAHVRFNERTDADGKRVLFIEEVQSDWAQKGRKEGFRVFKEVEFKTLGSGRVAAYFRGDRLGIWPTRAQAEESIVTGDSHRGVPSAPFVTKTESWAMLAMKRMIRYAAENGFDRVAWTTGEQQADRYDLSKKVSEVVWVNPASTGKDGRGTLHVYGQGGDGKILEKELDPKELADYIGKDAADKLLASQITTSDAGGGKLRRRIEANDLKVGGGGMRAFYDHMLPQWVNKYVKKWGVRVGDVLFGQKKYDKMFEDTEPRDIPLQDRPKQPGFDITPAMRDAVMQGQPLFSRGSRQVRQIYGLRDGRVVAAAVSESDGSWTVYRGEPSKTLLESKQYGRRRVANYAAAIRELDRMGLKVAEKRVPSGPAPEREPMFRGFDVPSESVLDYLSRNYQDKFRRVKIVQRALGKGGVISEENDAYLAEELYYGRTEDRLRRFEEQHVNPLIDAIKKADVSLEDIDRYLYAKHAPERNAHIASINPHFRENKIPGSGIADEEAAKILRDFDERGLTGKLEGIAQQVYEINTARLKLLEKEGLESPTTIALWRKPYERYVPLRGFEAESEAERPRTGRGYDIRGRESRRAFGRGSLAQSPLTYTIAQMEESIIRSEKNRVGRTFLKLVQANPNPELWEINKVEYKPRYDDRTGEVIYSPDKLHKLADNVLSVKVDGEQVLVTLHDDLLARAFKNIGAERTNVLVQALGTVNRFLAVVNTSLNPEFVISNFTRDLQTAIINLYGEQGAKSQLGEPKGIARKVLKDLPFAMAGTYAGLRGPDKAVFGQALKSENIQKWARWFDEYREAGGKIGFFGLDTIDNKRKRLARALKLAEGGPVAKAEEIIRAFGGLIMDVNGAVENGIRLSTYKNARELGLSKKRAASLARNLTVNFNRKGELGALANALYLFYNASVQGSIRVLYALRSPKVRKIAAGIVAGSFLLAELNRFIGGDDDDGENFYDKIDPWIKEHNLILMKNDGKGGYWSIPVPYGYNVLHVIGIGMNDMLHSGNPGRVATRTIIAAMNAFNPLGSDAGLLQMISPTIVDPFVQVATNENFFGAPVKPEQRGFGPRKPESQLYWSTVSPVSKAVTDTLNELTGGNTVRPGVIDISPEVLDHFVSQFFGGAGAFVNRSINYVALLTQDKEIPARKIPFVRRFSGEQSEFYVSRKFGERIDQVKLAYEEVQAFRKQGKMDEAREARDRHRDLLSLYGKAKALDQQIHEDRRRIRNVRAAKHLNDEEKERRVTSIRERMDTRMKSFNKLYMERVGND